MSIIDATTTKILVEVRDFLGNITTNVTDWYLTTNRQSVATITDNQIINFIGKCEVSDPLVVGLYLANGTMQQSVRFVVEETGYASKVIAKIIR